MAEQDEIRTLQGIDVLLYVRLLSKAGTEAAKLVPFQTSLSFDPQRDSDSTATKSGNVATTSSLETDLEVEFINNVSAVADDLYTSLFDNEKVEAWIVYRKRVKKGQYFAWYMRGVVTEDSSDNDPDDASTRDTTFTVDGTPKKGWVTLPKEAEKEISYVFRGLAAVTEAKNDGTDGDGTPWKDEDRGTGDDRVEEAPKA